MKYYNIFLDPPYLGDKNEIYRRNSNFKKRFLHCFSVFTIKRCTVFNSFSNSINKKEKEILKCAICVVKI